MYCTFSFCPSEAGADTRHESLNEKMYSRLTTKMIHSHGKKLVQNRALPSGQAVDAPLMLCEELKSSNHNEQRIDYYTIIDYHV